MNAAQAQAAGWDAAAQGWDCHRSLVRAWLHEATELMLDAAGVRVGARVLDVAAGAGDQTLDIVQRVGPTGEVLATDISAAILARALARLRAAGHGANVRASIADAQSLELDGADFDAAVCRLGLMFCSDPASALRGIHASLAPGGRFAALVFSGPERNPCITTLVQTALAMAGEPPGDPYAPGTLLSLGRPGQLHALMVAAGFGAVRVRAIDAPMHTASVGDYVAFVRSAGSPVIRLLEALPEPRREAAWTEIGRRLSGHASEGGWVGPNELLLVSGARPSKQVMER